MPRLSNGSAVGVGFRLLQERSKEGGEQYRGGYVADSSHGRLLGTQVLVMEPPRMGVVRGSVPWELCSSVAFLWALPMQGVISTLLPPCPPPPSRVR